LNISLCVLDRKLPEGHRAMFEFIDCTVQGCGVN